MEERYEIREKIGQGGIGSVYRGYDRKMNRQVAIKRILISSKDPELVAESANQLVAEIGALCSLQHSHIVTVFDIGSDEDGPYVVMELIEGKNLGEIIEESTLAWEDFRIVALQSLEAMVAAHHIGIIHRDIKPPNIMVSWMASGAFQIKIVDFGLAMLTDAQYENKIAGMDAVYGSVFFMPPEQYECKALDARSDIYSLGCCFYHSLTGAYPFDGKTEMEVMQAHLSHTVWPVQKMRDDIPLWACDWIMWLINRYPDARPPSMHEALINFQENERIHITSTNQDPVPSQQSRAVASTSPPAAVASPAPTKRITPAASISTPSPGNKKPFTGKLIAASATGRRCLTNEDRHLIDLNRGCFAIAGGVHDLPFGERASECVIRHLTREIAHPESHTRALQAIVASCHQAVYDLGSIIAPPAGTGATVTLVRFTPSRSVLLAHIGDNTAYLHPARLHPIIRLTADHTLRVSPAPAPGSPQAPLRVARYLGQAIPPACEIRTIPLDPEDRLILCSSGITRVLAETEIAALSALQPSAQVLARALVKIADIRGRSATALVIDIPPLR